MRQMNGRKRLLFFFVAMATLLAFGCGVDQISKANFDRIKTGMSEAEVQAILGPPTESTGVDVTVFAGTNSLWKKGETVISIQFVNGKVVAKQFSKTPTSG
jgi:outer membrane protein assembly factor BamE (lipoprotein component of BamABCDE complex)